jgi:hypothetical protein
LAADRKQRVLLDLVHVDAHADLVAHGLVVALEGLARAEDSQPGQRSTR